MGMDYRKLAAEAYQQAERALTDENRAAWMKIAQGYKSLADQIELRRASRFKSFFRRDETS